MIEHPAIPGIPVTFIGESLPGVSRLNGLSRQAEKSGWRKSIESAQTCRGKSQTGPILARWSMSESSLGRQQEHREHISRAHYVDAKRDANNRMQEAEDLRFALHGPRMSRTRFEATIRCTRHGGGVSSNTVTRAKAWRRFRHAPNTVARSGHSHDADRKVGLQLSRLRGGLFDRRPVTLTSLGSFRFLADLNMVRHDPHPLLCRFQ